MFRSLRNWLVVLTPLAGFCVAQSARAADARHYEKVALTCLSDFDLKARAKKLTAETYKIAVEGACSEDIDFARTTLTIETDNNPNQAYKLDQFDRDIAASKSKLITAYIMR